MFDITSSVSYRFIDVIDSPLFGNMELERLEEMSYEQLRDELIKWKLPITTSRSDCIDRLMSFYERNGIQGPCDQKETTASSSHVTLRSTQGLDGNPSLHSATMEQMQRSTLLMAQMQKQQHIIERLACAVTISDTGGRDALPTEALVPSNQRSSDTISSQPIRNLTDSTDIRDSNRHVNDPHTMASASPAQAVKLLANQISVFSGTKDDDIEGWIRKVERVASIHGVQDGVTLLAASNKLSKNAREWFDLDDGQVNDSWSFFKNAIIKKFKRYIPFHVLMQKVEARKWNFPKETFQDYALQKMKLMNNLQMPEHDRIQLIINGINSLSLRSTAAAISTNSMDNFLEQMGRITSAYGVIAKKSSLPPAKKDRTKSLAHSAEATQHSVKSSSAVICVYCKAKSHVKSECYKLRKKEQLANAASSSAVTPETVPETQRANPSHVGCIFDDTPRTLKISNSIVEIHAINGSKCSMFALIDTGSPVSFMLSSVHKLFFGQNVSYDKPVTDNLVTLSNTSIKVLGLQDTNIGVNITREYL